MASRPMPSICLDCRYIKPRPSGIAAVVQALVDFLPELAPDWRFTFLRHASLNRPLSDAPNVTEIVLKAQANSPATMWWMPRQVDFNSFDLFHSPSNILPRGIPPPTVTTIHDIMWLTDPKLCKAGLWGRVEATFYGNGIRRALDRSDAILTVSEATRRAIVGMRPELAERTVAALPGVPAHFRPSDDAPKVLNQFGISARDYILTVGQSAPYKNHAGAIRGFAAALADREDMHLVIVQRQGSGANDLLRLADEIGVGARVHFLPPQTDEDLSQLYSGARALLHPSLCEGFGMPLAEAMASGCPVVTSNISAMPEVTGDSALLIDPSDPASIGAALRRIVDEPGLADTLRQKGLERASQLDRRNFAAANLAIYRRVLGYD